MLSKSYTCTWELFHFVLLVSHVPAWESFHFVLHVSHVPGSYFTLFYMYHMYLGVISLCSTCITLPGSHFTLFYMYHLYLTISSSYPLTGAGLWSSWWSFPAHSQNSLSPLSWLRVRSTHFQHFCSPVNCLSREFVSSCWSTKHSVYVLKAMAYLARSAESFYTEPVCYTV